MHNLGDKDAIDIAKEKLDEVWDAIQARDSQKINSALNEVKEQIEHLESIIAVHHS